MTAAMVSPPGMGMRMPESAAPKKMPGSTGAIHDRK